MLSVAVIGSGPAGLTAAVALAQAGITTVNIGRRPVGDRRTTALLDGSVRALETLGVWPSCAGQAAALRVMRIVDDTGRLIRAPEVRFSSDEIGLDAFGYNIANADLLTALDRRARQLPGLSLIEQQVAAVTPADDTVAIQLDNGETITAQLAIGADGRRSMCRDSAGITVDERPYPQSALALSFRHSRPHDGISTEFHTRSGPFTQVPLPGERSSLVWVVDPSEAADIDAMDDDALSIEIEHRSHSIYGKVTVEPGRSLFPLTVLSAQPLAGRRIALVGEAAHVLPPIGAQGLNIGLRDAATIAELAVAAIRDGDDPGCDDVLRRYEKLRRPDIASRTMAVDLLNRSLLTDFLPAQGARGIGLYLLGRIAPLRRAAMKEGVHPVAAQPRLMRGETI
jgi:2-octaprenyl-6-methoxyphenol hydroxylase